MGHEVRTNSERRVERGWRRDKKGRRVATEYNTHIT
jgi:hypothetical protein